MNQPDLLPPEKPEHTERDYWLEQRKLGIGASEAAAAIGVSPWTSRRALYEVKVGNVDSDSFDSEAAYWGNMLEAPVRDRCSEELGQEIENPGQYTIQQHPKYSFMRCTLDGKIRVANGDVIELFNSFGMEATMEGPGDLQIKTTSAFNASDWADDWPLYYQVQTQHELEVTGMTWGILAVLIGGQQFKMFPFVKNARFCQSLIEAESKFWQQVQDRDPPPPDGSDSTADVLGKLYPEEDGGEVELPEESLLWDARRIEALATKKDAEAKMKECDNLLKDAIGSNATGVLPDGSRYNWKTVNRKGYTVEPTSYRQLRRKKSDG